MNKLHIPITEKMHQIGDGVELPLPKKSHIKRKKYYMKEILNPSEEVKEFMEGSIGYVEANNFETMVLWQLNNVESKRKWEENNSGVLVTVGNLYDRPICIALTYAIIDGQKILFVEPTSTLVDWDIIEEWMKTYLPKTAMRSEGKYINKTNAMNFHLIFLNDS